MQAELKLEKAGVAVCFVSDREIARMNQVFRKKMGPTDVLSFPAQERRKIQRRGAENAGSRGEKRSEKWPFARPWRAQGKRAGNAVYMGDIAISPMTARRNAKKFGRPLSTELRVLILHGILHLLGYDHETDRGRMERVEKKLRRRLRLT